MDYFFTFLEGFASFISPCILPMIPIYISYFMGQDKNNTKKATINSIGFVLGFTLSFIVLSIIASLLGSILSIYIKYIKIVFGIIIILLGLNYMELLKISFLNRTKGINSNPKNTNFIKTFLFGIIFSISWTPCVGSFLSSALMLIAKEQNIIKGIALICIYSLGLGVPFVVSATLANNLKDTFDFFKRHYNVVKVISGLILIVMGTYLIFF